MLRSSLGDHPGGWFVGNFEEALYKTDLAEVAVKTHYKGESWRAHYQRSAVEINHLLSGELSLVLWDINDPKNRSTVHLKAGEFFLIEPNIVAEPTFLSDCKLVVVKIPSIPGDKVEV